MNTSKYIIIGGGMTAASAVKGIREVDPTGTITLFSEETHPPYNRPPLSKKLWKGGRVEDIWRTVDESVDMVMGRSIVQLDPRNKTVTDSTGETYLYGKLLLATGGIPRILPFGQDSILYYRTFNDYLMLQDRVQKGGEFAIIGGGFIGSELAAALCLNKQPVTMVFPGNHIGERVFPLDLAQYVTDYYRDQGVEIKQGDQLLGVEKYNGRLLLRLKSGNDLIVDHVVAGIGIRPNIELAEAAGLAIDDGIMVDEYLQTNASDVYAAGDVAAFYAPALEKRTRVEHEDNANTMGRIAGRNMAGAKEAYDYLPMFYSDLFDLGYEAVGELNSALETYADWQEPNKKGVVYYLNEGRVRGVLLWNVWDKVKQARELIQSPEKFTKKELQGRL